MDLSQSLLFHAFGVREGYEYWRTEYQDGCVRFFLLVKPEQLVCPQCQSREVNRKGRRFRELQTVPIGLRPVYLVTEVPKCQCRDAQPNTRAEVEACNYTFPVSPRHPTVKRKSNYRSPSAVAIRRSGASNDKTPGKHGEHFGIWQVKKEPALANSFPGLTPQSSEADAPQIAASRLDAAAPLTSSSTRYS